MMGHLTVAQNIFIGREPRSGLFIKDAAMNAEARKLFKQLNREGTTVIMITHDANIASNAKRILHIFDGKITEDERREADPIG